MGYSVVIPIYNEAESIGALLKEIQAVKPRPQEILVVDDGSQDGTFDALKKIADITIIRFRRNFGQSAAMAAGIAHAKSDVIVTMDGDGQNDPKDIPKLLAKLDEGYDAVSGWRHRRKDPIMKHVMSRIANYLRHFVISDHLHDAGCSLKAYRRECFEDFELYGELHRYIAEMLGLKGFRVGEVKVNHRARKAGKTKYSTKRVVKGFLDLFLIWFWQKYVGRPLHLFGGLGLLAGLLGMILSIYSIYLWIFTSLDLSDTFLPVIAIFLILAGIQLFIAGIMSDLLARNYNKGRHRYSIQEVVDT